MDSTLSQSYAALAFAYAGIVLGCCYDVLRLIRLLADRKTVTHLTDLLFVVLFAAIGYLTFHIGTHGVVRPYGLVCMALGAALQQWAFGRAVCKRIVTGRK